MAERTEGKLRPGESKNKPFGGNVSSKPLSQALYNLARSRGFETQRGLARALGTRQIFVYRWYRGIGAPSRGKFDAFVNLVQPTPEEMATLRPLYDAALAEGKGRSDDSMKGSKRARMVGVRSRKAPKRPYEEWLYKFCDERGITLTEANSRLGLSPSSRPSGLPFLAGIIENAREAWDLDKDELSTLTEAVARTIEQGFERSRHFGQGGRGTYIRRIQKELACRTYTGAQAAEALGVSRERVRQVRKKKDFPLLMTGEHIEEMRNMGVGQSGRGKSRILKPGEPR